MEEKEWDGKVALFINSETTPDEIVGLDNYAYKEQGGKLRFFRLCELKYLEKRDETNGIYHSVLSWEQIEIKPHCETALKNMCDAMRGAKEFLM
jgi:hypothetical protein